MTVSERCPKCNALIALVGRVHRCTPKQSDIDSYIEEVIQPGQAKTGRPRIEDRDKTLAATKPWLKLGMSERTWYRRQREKGK
jgi:hypothetical protein